MMEQKSIENFKKLVVDFRALTANVKKHNQKKTKNLKECSKLVKKSIKNCILSTKNWEKI